LVFKRSARYIAQTKRNMLAVQTGRTSPVTPSVMKGWNAVTNSADATPA
jgi:hypothetical protein